MRLVFIALTAATLAGCSSLNFRGSGTTPPGLAPGTPEASDPDRTAPDGGSTTIRACRTSSIPRGWIAVAYIPVGNECPTADSYDGYNGVVLERYRDRSTGTVLAVCSDQRTPSGWADKAAPPDIACPGPRVSEGDPTAKLITRIR